MNLKRKAVDLVLRHNTANKRSKLDSPNSAAPPNHLAPTNQATVSPVSAPETNTMSDPTASEPRQRTSASNTPTNPAANATSSSSDSESLPKVEEKALVLQDAMGDLTASKYTRKRLAPARPWPIVPTSVTASGPRSSHIEGKNYICITRKTETGAYLRRFRDLILKDGYKTLHLSALGAAIPLLTILATSLPLVLPHGPDEIQFEWLTGTVQVTDELIPDGENEDVQYEERGKSNLVVIIRIDGGDDAANTIPRKSKKVSTKRDVNRPPGKRLVDLVVPVKPPQPVKPIVVFQEPDQDDGMGE